MRFRPRLTFFIASTIILLAVSGCAVQPNGNYARQGPRAVFDPDALTAVTLRTIRLPDGTDALLRQAGSRYSLKLQRYQRVIPIGEAQSVRFVDVREVDGRALLTLERAEPGCPHKFQVFSLDGPAVSAWDIGNCVSPARISGGNASATFDFAAGQPALRYVFRAGQMVPEAPVAHGGALPRTPSGTVPPMADDAYRYVPPLPIPVGRSSTMPAAGATAGATSTAASTPAAVVRKDAAKPVARVAASESREPAPASARPAPKPQRATLTLILDK